MLSPSQTIEIKQICVIILQLKMWAWQRYRSWVHEINKAGTQQAEYQSLVHESTWRASDTSGWLWPVWASDWQLTRDVRLCFFPKVGSGSTSPLWIPLRPAPPQPKLTANEWKTCVSVAALDSVHMRPYGSCWADLKTCTNYTGRQTS